MKYIFHFLFLSLTSLAFSHDNKSESYAISPKYTQVTEPDPAKNNSTLLGIDSDKNGVRDDIQVWIIQNFKDSPVIIQAFSNLASATQLSLHSKITEINLIKLLLKLWMLRPALCIQ